MLPIAIVVVSLHSRTAVLYIVARILRVHKEMCNWMPRKSTSTCAERVANFYSLLYYYYFDQLWVALRRVKTPSLDGKGILSIIIWNYLFRVFLCLIRPCLTFCQHYNWCNISVFTVFCAQSICFEYLNEGASMWYYRQSTYKYGPIILKTLLHSLARSYASDRNSSCQFTFKNCCTVYSS